MSLCFTVFAISNGSLCFVSESDGTSRCRHKGKRGGIGAEHFYIYSIIFGVVEGNVCFAEGVLKTVRALCFQYEVLGRDAGKGNENRARSRSKINLHFAFYFLCFDGKFSNRYLNPCLVLNGKFYNCLLATKQGVSGGGNVTAAVYGCHGNSSLSIVTSRRNTLQGSVLDTIIRCAYCQ